MSDRPHDPEADARLLDGVRAAVAADARRAGQDGGAPGSGESGGSAPALAIEDAPVLELTPAMRVRTGPGRASDHPDRSMEAAMESTPAREAATGSATDAPSPPTPAGEPDALVGGEAAARSGAAFGSLREAIRGQRRSAPIHRDGPTLEDVLREEMRPMIRDWIDANLPAIVERAVQAEVERMVARGVD